MKIKITFKKINEYGYYHELFGIIIIVLIAVGGAGYLVASHAATPSSIASSSTNYKKWTLIGYSAAQAPKSSEVFTVYACMDEINPSEGIVKAEYVLSSSFSSPYKYSVFISDSLPSSTKKTIPAVFTPNSKSNKIETQLNVSLRTINSLWFYQASTNGHTAVNTKVNVNSVYPALLQPC